MSDFAKIYRELMKDAGVSQRKLAALTGFSLGKTNKLLKTAIQDGCLTRRGKVIGLTDEGLNFMRRFRADNAVILAAGFGSRFVPVTFEIPKGLVEVRGQPMIERQIEQLIERGIRDVTIVTGYLKEKFDYLIDKYGARLVFNPEYAAKNNLASLVRVIDLLKNTYVLSADNWMRDNIFNLYETESWYSCVYAQGRTSEWCVSCASDGRIKDVRIGGFDSWVMYGPVFFSDDFSRKFIPLLKTYYDMPGSENMLWENVLIKELDNLDIKINKQPADNVYEFESLQELMAFDSSYATNSGMDSITVAARVLGVSEEDIRDIRCVKQGMTNRSFAFTVNEQDYIYRIPGEGAADLLNRHQERASYQAIEPLGISDEVVWFDENSGVKISRYYSNARTMDASDTNDVKDCVAMLRRLHESGVSTPHHFDISDEIVRYRSLCDARSAIRFRDIEETHAKIAELSLMRGDIEACRALCHVDCNADNVIRLEDGTVRIIDWEYAGMADPMIDVAMFAIYSYYDKQKIDELLEIYLGRRANASETLRVYIFTALGGYLWALWSEYKQSFGVEFGEYGIKMYRYAKDFYKHAKAIGRKQ